MIIMLSKISKRKKYRDKFGNMYTQMEINTLVREAKEEVKERYLSLFGYLFCADCQRNDCLPIEMSHTISMKEAKETGQAQLCWDVENIKPRGRPCHAKLDKLYLGNNN